MLFMPFNVLGLWLRGLLSLLLLGGGIYLLAEWYNHREIREPVVVVHRTTQAAGTEEYDRVVPWQFGFNRETAFLLGGLALLVWSLGGGLLVSPRLLRRSSPDQPKTVDPGNVQRIRLDDGSELHVQCFGPADGDPVVLTHGWGLDHNEWCYAVKELAGRYRIIVWDLPGLGGSSRPADRDWSLERLARDLDQVLVVAGGKPAVLIGHSIGTMIVLTYCKLFPEALGSRVRALVLAHGTYTNPVRTTSRAGLYTALQKPVLEPLCHLMVWLSPLVRVLNGLSYLNGSAHRSTERDAFSGQETREQLDFITRYYYKAPPDVVGRGMLGMFRYDATAVLSRIQVPTLIVAGDNDRTCTPDASRYMASAIAGARLLILSQARHCGLFEHHESFHSTVAEFVNASMSFPGSGSRPREVPLPQRQTAH